MLSLCMIRESTVALTQRPPKILFSKKNFTSKVITVILLVLSSFCSCGSPRTCRYRTLAMSQTSSLCKMWPSLKSSWALRSVMWPLCIRWLVYSIILVGWAVGIYPVGLRMKIMCRCWSIKNISRCEISARIGDFIKKISPMRRGILARSSR